MNGIYSFSSLDGVSYSNILDNDVQRCETTCIAHGSSNGRTPYVGLLAETCGMLLCLNQNII